MRECEWCGTSIVRKNAQARFCSTKCRVASHRTPRNLERLLGNRKRWVTWDDNKAPRQANGSYASTTRPETWAALATLKGHTRLGYVLGDGTACIDLDHCLNDDGTPTDAAATFLEDYRGHYIEISPSGQGLHIWGVARPAPGTRRRINGLSIERYSGGRYITVTGNVYQHGELLPL